MLRHGHSLDGVLLSAQICNAPFTSRGVTKSVGSSSVTTSLSAALSSCAPPEGKTAIVINIAIFIKIVFVIFNVNLQQA